MNEIHVRLQFVVPIKDIQVIRMEAERPRHVEVPRKECEYERDGNAEPEDRRLKQEMIVAVDRCAKPSRRDNGIDGLKQRIRTQRTPKVGGEKTYGVCPDEYNANKHGEKHPTGPKLRIEAVEEICRDSCRDDHRR